MRILLDECVNPRIRLAFSGGEVKTVAEMGWRSMTNGRLMQEAEPHLTRPGLVNSVQIR
jgi:hypothetical protein